MIDTQGKPTPGPWLAEDHSNRCRVYSPFIGTICETFGQRTPESEANAALIAEAGTVYSETGMGPRKLVNNYLELQKCCGRRDGEIQRLTAQRKELEAAVKPLLEWLNHLEKHQANKQMGLSDNEMATLRVMQRDSPCVTVGDIRAIRTALDNTKEEDSAP